MRKIEELAGRVPGKTDQPEYDPAHHVPAGYLAMREARHGFGRPEPTIWIDMAAIKGLHGQFGLGPQGGIELTNVSSQPSLTGQPTVVAIQAPQHATRIVATLNLHQPQSQHEVRFTASDINLAALVSQRSPRMPLAVQGGTIHLAGQGWLTSQEFELNLQAELRDLHAQVQSQQTLAGLPPQLWTDGLAQLDHLQMDAVVFGRWSSPRVKVDTDRLVQQFKEQLLAAGQTLLAQAVDEQVARGQAMVERAVDDSLAHAEEAVANAAARVDGMIAQGETRATGVVGRVEQSAAAAQQTVQQWQNQFGAAGRFLQENVAAGALTAPGPHPNQLQPLAPASHRRQGPPPFLYGDIVGAAGIENTPASEPVQTVAVVPAPQAVPAVEGFRYPDAVRSFAPQPPVEVRPAPTGVPSMNRPASFNAPPPPAMMELGYEDRRPPQQPAMTMPPARVASRPNVAGRTPGSPVATLPSSTQQTAAATTAPVEEAPTVRSRIGNFSRNMTEKVKGVVPWPNRDEGAEAIVSDEPSAPRTPARPAQPTRPRRRRVRTRPPTHPGTAAFGASPSRRSSTIRVEPRLRFRNLRVIQTRPQCRRFHSA